MPRITLPTPSPQIADSERRGIVLAEKLEAAKAELRRVSSPDYKDEQSADRVAAIARGETPGPRKTRTARIEEAKADVVDKQAAHDLLAKQHTALLKQEEQRVRQSVQEAVDAEYKTFASALARVFASLRVIDQVKRDLSARGFGFYGLPCRLDTDRVFRESVFDRASDLAQLLRQCAECSYLAKIPEGLR